MKEINRVKVSLDARSVSICEVTTYKYMTVQKWLMHYLKAHLAAITGDKRPTYLRFRYTILIIAKSRV